MVEIRLVDGDERETLFAMAQRSWQEWMPQAPVVTDPIEGAKYFASHFQIGAPNTSVWWGHRGGKLIGFARLELREDWRSLPWAELTDFYIEPQWRRRGHGTGFAQALLAWLERQGNYRFDLNVRVSLLPVVAPFWDHLRFEVVMYRFRRQDAEQYRKEARS